MRLLDLVEQQHAMRMLVDAVGQQAALVEADIAGRRADQARDRVALHIFRHVEAQQLDAERSPRAGGRPRSCRRRSGRRTDRQPIGFSGSRRPARASLIAGRERLDGLVLAVDDALRASSSRLRSTSASSLETVLGGMRAMVAIVASISLTPIVFLRAALGHQHLRGAGLVDHVDRLVGQLAVIDVARRQLHRRLDGVVGVAQLVELLEIGLQALQDLDGVRHRRLVDVDLLEAAHQGAVLLEILAVFLVGGRADAAQRARGERRLQQVRGIHRAARGRAGADHRVDLVDEQDRLGMGLDLLHHLLQALLEIAAIAGAGEQRAHVEREDRRVVAALPAPRRVTILRARPSAIAVLPTPGSPTSSGLFFWRRHRTWIVRCTSASRPISGSILPSFAFLLRLTQ